DATVWVEARPTSRFMPRVALGRTSGPHRSGWVLIQDRLTELLNLRRGGLGLGVPELERVEGLRICVVELFATEVRHVEVGLDRLHDGLQLLVRRVLVRHARVSPEILARDRALLALNHALDVQLLAAEPRHHAEGILWILTRGRHAKHVLVQ